MMMVIKMVTVEKSLEQQQEEEEDVDGFDAVNSSKNTQVD